MKHIRTRPRARRAAHGRDVQAEYLRALVTPSTMRVRSQPVVLRRTAGGSLCRA